MNSQDFLTLNVVGVVVFLLWYLLSRGGYQAPTKLNLKAKDRAPTVLAPEPKEKGASEDSAINHLLASDQQIEKPAEKLYSPQLPLRRSLQLVRQKPAEVKNLNVMFNYNGHSWDAYEVLGVPAGASLPIVTEAYQRAIKRCEKESIEFLETAYKAILEKK